MSIRITDSVVHELGAEPHPWLAQSVPRRAATPLTLHNTNAMPTSNTETAEPPTTEKTDARAHSAKYAESLRTYYSQGTVRHRALKRCHFKPTNTLPPWFDENKSNFRDGLKLKLEYPTETRITAWTPRTSLGRAHPGQREPWKSILEDRGNEIHSAM
jgi:hypothetical protein